MKKIIIGSHNPVKLNVTKEVFEKCFPDEIFEYETYKVDSGVPDQPFGDTQTRTGAKNRTDACKKESPDADYFVGLEGGLEEINDEFWAFAWMCVQGKDGTYGFGKTGAFLLPPKVSEYIHKGEELGTATDIAFNDTDTKRRGGTVGILTNEMITRTDFYRDALVFALIPFLKPELYS